MSESGPEVGQPAPDFTARDANLTELRLSELRGRKVLLVFYPFAFTGVCSTELRSLRAELDSLGPDTEVIAVSCDPPGALRAFAEAEGLPYRLVSDFWPHGAVARAYGVFDETLGAAARGTFVIDRDGVVRWKVRNPLGEARSLADYRRALAELD
jgi:peroxiredoxin